MPVGYAYIDKTDKAVFHIVDTAAEAHKEASGDVFEVTVPYKHGYPVVKGEQLVIYKDGHEKDGKTIPAEIAAIVAQLR